MRGGQAGRLAASPTMVGAVTVLIVVVAVFLAYQANSGLPFVPTYRISATVPDAATLVPGNEVRIGGARVGLVEAVTPEQNEDGTTDAVLDLKLDKDIEPLPDDSTVIVRARSALGLKYLEIDRGNSEEGLPPGATLSLAHARPEPVEIDQLFDTFDEPTREASQVNLREFGNALAGRGPDLNEGLQELLPVLVHLEPVMKNLASRRTQLGRFVAALSATAAEVAPVAQEQANLFVSLDTTFGAFARVARPFIQESIEKGPNTLQTTAETLPRIRPFLRDTTALFGDLRPGFAALRPAAPQVVKTLQAGIPALRVAPAFNAQLDPTAQSLLDFNNDANNVQGINDLTDFNEILKPTIAFVGPAQYVCNYATLLFRNTSSLLSLGDGIGSWQRFIPLNPPTGPNNEGSPSSAPANGGVGSSASNFLHTNPYPNTASPGQTFECEAGNEPWLPGQTVIGNVPGNQGIRTDAQLKSQLNAKPSGG